MIVYICDDMGTEQYIELINADPTFKQQLLGIASAKATVKMECAVEDSEIYVIHMPPPDIAI